MEHMLQKMARQLNAFDEASLMALWDKYATIVERFEPTKRWEEAALVFSLIQAVRLKNQLFNQHLAADFEARKHSDPNLPGFAETRNWLEKRNKRSEAEQGSVSASAQGEAKKRRKVLGFPGSKGDKPV